MMNTCKPVFGIALLMLAVCLIKTVNGQTLTLNDKDYFETRGLNVMVFSNWYNGLFSDSKMSGIEIIHHEVRTATNGDVRLGPTPEQWDPIPTFVKRDVKKESKTIEAFLKYPDYNFNYSIQAVPKDNGLLISVHLESPLPAALEGKAGFNLEFLPSAYFGKSYLADNGSGVFPLYPSGPMQVTNGTIDPKPIATGNLLVLAPGDPERSITIKSNAVQLSLYDGRNKAQNGWFVVRSLLPANKPGKVPEWFISGTSIPGRAGNNYLLHKAFPGIIDAESVFRGLNYIYGCHPGSDISFVSAVGTESKKVAYGSNRADYSFIAGGIVPGVLILPPDFPENKEDWPFLWGENEYVIPLGAGYIFLVHAVNDLLGEKAVTQR